jgi:hypothetical protein
MGSVVNSLREFSIFCLSLEVFILNFCSLAVSVFVYLVYLVYLVVRNPG